MPHDIAALLFYCCIYGRRNLLLTHAVVFEEHVACVWHAGAKRHSDQIDMHQASGSNVHVVLIIVETSQLNNTPRVI